MPQEYAYKVTKKDLEKCWDFSVKYYLDPSKPTYDRTNKQGRGLGGVADSFFNKIIEIGICKILHDINNAIEPKTDFEIHPLNKKKTEPDIIKVGDRDPKLYVEIKNIGEMDEWIGPKLGEVESIRARPETSGEDAIYYVYCEIRDSKGGSGREKDTLGVFLKELIPSDKNLQQFHDVADLEIVVKTVFNVKDIEDLGRRFHAGGMIPSTNAIALASDRTKPRKLQKISDGDFPEVKLQNNELPRLTSSKSERQNQEWMDYPNDLGAFTFQGNIEVYEERLQTLRHFWIKCNGNVKISNDVLGTKQFKNGDLVDYQITAKGQFEEKSVDDIWVARSNESKMSKLGPSRIEEIAKKI